MTTGRKNPGCRGKRCGRRRCDGRGCAERTAALLALCQPLGTPLGSFTGLDGVYYVDEDDDNDEDSEDSAVSSDDLDDEAEYEFVDDGEEEEGTDASSGSLNDLGLV